MLIKLCLNVPPPSAQMAPGPLEPVARRLMKAVIALELLGVLGAYGLFHKMNTSQGRSTDTHTHQSSNMCVTVCVCLPADFRSTMNRRFPSVLEGKLMFILHWSCHSLNNINLDH